MVIQIKKAKSKDAELIAGMSRETFIETYAKDNTAENMQLFLEGPFATKNLLKEVSASENYFVMAYCDEVLAGYMRLRNHATDHSEKGKERLEICRLYCYQKFIGKGIGHALMAHALEYGIKNKFEGMWLGVWERNLRAISFYEKYGFHKFSSHIFTLGDDSQTDWLMEKKLR